MPLELPPDLATPTIVVDETTLDDNIGRMAARAAARGLQLRPHVKTHKSVEIARRQIAAGAVGITVATVGEAEVFAAAGFDDIFIAYPLWLDRSRATRLRAVMAVAQLRLGVDSTESAERMAAALGGRSRDVRVLIEIDSGHHRSGVAPQRAGAVAVAAADAGLTVDGVFTFPGHSYSVAGRAAAARDESVALAAAADSLATAGLPARIVSGGSTPSVDYADSTVLTELRPGVYVFNDAQQFEIGTCGPEAIALSLLATIVSRADGRVIADTGSKVLGADRAPYSSGFGRIVGHDAARVVALSEHHATITGLDVPLGTRIRVVPNHVCSAVNLADRFLVVSRSGEAEWWPVDARGRNA